MSKFIVVGLLVVGVAVAAYVGCRPQMGVAKDKVVDKINTLLGKLNVQQKEVEIAFKDVKARTETMKEDMYNAKANLTNLERKRKELEENKNAILADMKALKPLMEEAAASESKAITNRKGEEVTLAELKHWTTAKVKKFNRNKALLEANKSLMDTWGKNVSILSKNCEVSEKQLEKLSSRIEEINNKKIALDAMVKSSKIAAPGVSLSDDFDDLTKNVDDLLVKVDAKLNLEEDKIDDRMATMEGSDDTAISDLLNDSTDIESTMSDLDAILSSEDQ